MFSFILPYAFLQKIAFLQQEKFFPAYVKAKYANFLQLKFSLIK
jgi:hypothetical protein